MRFSVHKAWLVLAVAFLVMLVTAGTRGTPSVMIVPLAVSFGWTLPQISAALSINLLLFGLMGPFAAAAMLRYGLRRSVLTALSCLGLGVGLSALMGEIWHLWILWGLVVGCASGVTASTFGATIVNRWFKEKRGLAMGLLAASTATGQLVFLPVLARLAELADWRSMVLLVAAVIAVILPLVFVLIPERPQSVGLRPYGEEPGAEAGSVPPPANPVAMAFATLAQAVKVPDFWLLFVSFFVCGASSNGYIGTHFITMCGDYGMKAVEGAGVLAMMGLLDVAGTTGSGWLSDRYNNRVLLFWYYGLRGLALLYLPFALKGEYLGLPLFVVFYGLDWIATVPPTLRLTTGLFGAQRAPIVFGWIFSGHQLGAAAASLFGGYIRESTGSYDPATRISGGLCILAAILVLYIGKNAKNKAVAGAAAE